MLEVEQARVRFGGPDVLRGVTLGVEEGQIVGLAGHNGAGKTTLLRAVMGLAPLAGGRIAVFGNLVRHGATAEVAQRGVAFVTQGRNVFRPLSVSDNLALAHEAAGAGALPLATVLDVFPALASRLGAYAGALSGGQQQMLSLAAALLRRPRLIMLDEPSTGLAPVLVTELFRTVERLSTEHGVAFLIVDQNVRALLALSRRIYVLKSGQVTYAGSPDGLENDVTLWKMF